MQLALMPTCSIRTMRLGLNQLMAASPGSRSNVRINFRSPPRRMPFNPTLGACTIHWVMFGNGLKTVIPKTMTGLLWTGLRASHQCKYHANTGCCAVARGSAELCTCVPLTATGSPLGTAAAISASVSPGRFSFFLLSFSLLLLGVWGRSPHRIFFDMTHYYYS